MNSYPSLKAGELNFCLRASEAASTSECHQKCAWWSNRPNTMVRSLPKTFALERGNDWQRTMLMCCTNVAHQLEACNAQGLHSWLLDPSQEASEASEFLRIQWFLCHDIHGSARLLDTNLLQPSSTICNHFQPRHAMHDALNISKLRPPSLGLTSRQWPELWVTSTL